MRLMNEIVSGIQVIKMYAWEKPFAKLVEVARRYVIWIFLSLPVTVRTTSFNIQKLYTVMEIIPILSRYLFFT